MDVLDLLEDHLNGDAVYGNMPCFHDFFLLLINEGEVLGEFWRNFEAADCRGSSREYARDPHNTQVHFKAR